MQRNVWRRETSLFPETGSTPRNTHCYMMVMLFLCLRKMFYNTLGIDEKQVRTVMKNNTDTGAPVKERQGWHTNHKTCEDRKRKVKQHIMLFNVIESHYVRKDAKFEYLPQDLNVAEMYHL